MNKKRIYTTPAIRTVLMGLDEHVTQTIGGGSPGGGNDQGKDDLSVREELMLLEDDEPAIERYNVWEKGW